VVVPLGAPRHAAGEARLEGRGARREVAAQADAENADSLGVDVRARGAQTPSRGEVRSSETYIGYERSEHMVPVPELKRDQEERYKLPKQLALNQWGLAGRWKVGSENALLVKAPGKITFRFHARDLHLVLGAGPSGVPVPFIVRLDGAAPDENHGSDIDAAGRGVVQGQRLYQLIRLKKPDSQDHTFEIEFLVPGIQAFAFTFG
jgi:hypothetical protein